MRLMKAQRRDEPLASKLFSPSQFNGELNAESSASGGR
jgi:hypothetical protein